MPAYMYHINRDTKQGGCESIEGIWGTSNYLGLLCTFFEDAGGERCE